MTATPDAPGLPPESPAAPLTTDAVLGGRLRLTQLAKGHRVGHDAILLAAAAPASARHLADLGAGVGSAGLAALLRLPGADALLVELDPGLAALARDNAQSNGLAPRCRVLADDVCALARPGGPVPEAAGAFDLILSNPPFNAVHAHQTSPDARKARAHMAQDGTLRDWITAAYRCLAPGGLLAMILRPEDLAPLLSGLEGRFGAADLLPVHPRPHRPAVRLIVRAVKGRRTAPVVLPSFILADAEGRASAEAEAVLRDLAPLPGR